MPGTENIIPKKLKAHEGKKIDGLKLELTNGEEKYQLVVEYNETKELFKIYQKGNLFGTNSINPKASQEIQRLIGEENYAKQIIPVFRDDYLLVDYASLIKLVGEDSVKSLEGSNSNKLNKLRGLQIAAEKLPQPGVHAHQAHTKRDVTHTTPTNHEGPQIPESPPPPPQPETRTFPPTSAGREQERSFSSTPSQQPELADGREGSDLRGSSTKLTVEAPSPKRKQTAEKRPQALGHPHHTQRNNDDETPLSDLTVSPQTPTTPTGGVSPQPRRPRADSTTSIFMDGPVDYPQPISPVSTSRSLVSARSLPRIDSQSSIRSKSPKNPFAELQHKRKPSLSRQSTSSYNRCPNETSEFEQPFSTNSQDTTQRAQSNSTRGTNPSRTPSQEKSAFEKRKQYQPKFTRMDAFYRIRAPNPIAQDAEGRGLPEQGRKR